MSLPEPDILRYFRVTSWSVLFLFLGYMVLVVGLAAAENVDTRVAELKIQSEQLWKSRRYKECQSMLNEIESLRVGTLSQTAETVTMWGLLTLLFASAAGVVIQVKMLRDPRYSRSGHDWQRLRGLAEDTAGSAAGCVLLAVLFWFAFFPVWYCVWCLKLLRVCNATAESCRSTRLLVQARAARSNGLVVIACSVLLPVTYFAMWDAPEIQYWLCWGGWLLVAYGVYFLGHLLIVLRRTTKVLKQCCQDM